MSKFVLSNRIGYGLFLIRAAILCLIFLCPVSTVLGRALYDPATQDTINTLKQGNDPYTTCAVHDINKMGMTVTNMGIFGNGFSTHIGSHDPVTGTPTVSAAYPYPTPCRYLYAGAIWIGTVIGRDTLVSVGADGWNRVQEMFAASLPAGDIAREEIDSIYGYLSDQIFMAIYTDTVTLPWFAEMDPYDGRPHLPLNIEITQTSHAGLKPDFEIPPSDHDFIIFDYAVKNIGRRSLDDVYIGIFVDGDVTPSSAGTGDYQDDICGFKQAVSSPVFPGDCGFVDTVNIAWIADNDGRRANSVNPCPYNFSMTSVTGIKLLRLPEGANQFSFNWWLSHGSPSLDFGPRRAGVLSDPFRDFGGHLGTPTGDRNKYYIMRHREFDYDQMFTALSHVSEGWLPPPADAANFADGYDTRYLLSFGPVDIEPGETVSFTFAYVGGENFHTDCEAFDNLFDPYNPYPFYDQLNFSELARNAIWASWAFDTPGVDTDGDGYSGNARWCNGEIMWYEGDGVPDLYPLTLPINAIIKPEPQHIIMAQFIDPSNDTIVFGNLEYLTVYDINMSSIQVNGSITPASIVPLSEYDGFDGAVMQIVFPARDFILTYGTLYDTANYPFSVSGIYENDTPFILTGMVEIIGHRSGDMNGDGMVNVADVLYLINHYYLDGPPPVLSEDMADYNHDGIVNLSDIIDLINDVFQTE